MNSPELRFLTPDEFEEGKRLIVRPDRLSTKGLYSFMLLKRRFSDSTQAGLDIPVRIKESDPQTSLGCYIVQYSIDTNGMSPDDRKRVFPVILGDSGMVDARLMAIKEGYFAHRFDEVDDELTELTTRQPITIEDALVLVGVAETLPH